MTLHCSGKLFTPREKDLVKKVQMFMALRMGKLTELQSRSQFLPSQLSNRLKGEAFKSHRNLCPEDSRAKDAPHGTPRMPCER